MPTTLKGLILVLLFLTIAGYAAYQLRGVWQGPRLVVATPYAGQTLSDPILLITGQAVRADKIHIDDHKILPEENGHFSEKLILAEGYNVIEVTAEDRFGRLTEVKLPVVLSNHE